MRYIAFLRAINVGGHVVKMDQLRSLFESLGHKNVETFIASGNVIFESSSKSPAKLETAIEDTLQKALGYPVTTFVRAAPELVALAAHPRLVAAEGMKGKSLLVAFVRSTPAAAAAKKLVACSNDVDRFSVHEREVLWECRGGFSDSTFSGNQLEKTLGMPATVRNSTTVRRIAAKYGG